MPSDSSGYRPLLGRRMRGPAVAAIVLALIVIAALGMRYAGQDMAGRGDRILDAMISHRLRGGRPITYVLANLGDPAQTAILVAVVAGAAAVARRWSGVLLAIAGTTVAVAVTELILKPLIGRLRSGELSFPSGHTTAVAAVAVAAAILIGGARWPRSIALRVLAAIAAIAVAAGVAVSLVAQHLHYLTDTVGGYCVAVATVLGVALGLDYWCAARQRGDGGLAG
ncbi:MAG TPA: phosphatase PAP2 family protein [Pseudonocardiaceae bacterium]|nr:phosphatase PAP2 family protein [Pseudonocardiaceae bacterium]